MKYLHVSGTLWPDNHFNLRTGYLDERPRPIFKGASSFQVEQWNAAGQRLLTSPLPLMSDCSLGKCPPGNDVQKVRGWIPFARETRLIRCLSDGIVVHEKRVSAGHIALKITRQPVVGDGERVVIEWSATHSENQSLAFFCRFSNDDGKRWHRVGPWSVEQRAEFDLHDFPGGKACRFAVIATDGVNTTTVASDSFVVEEKPPVMFIFEPRDGTCVIESDHVAFVGQAFVMEEDRVEKRDLIWYSSLDGELGRGNFIQRQFLSPGRHEITLSLLIGGRLGEAKAILDCRPSAGRGRPEAGLVGRPALSLQNSS